MTFHSTDISVVARLDALPGLMAKVEHLAAGIHLQNDDALRLQMIVEELFVNTITHGHGGNSTHTVQVSLIRHDDGITLRYIDQAPPFDLTKKARKFASTAEIGGLGIGLILGMSKAVRHTPLSGGNLVEIDF